MYAQVEKPKENKCQSVASAVSQKQSSSEPAFQFVDNRPETITQRKLQEMANNSPQAKKSTQLRTMNSYQISADAPLQAVWILRNGSPVWEEDPYVLQVGEEYYNPDFFQQNPSVIFDKGRKQVTYDSSGAPSVTKKLKKPPTHSKLQKTRRKQGEGLRARAKKRSIQELTQDTQELETLAEILENQAGDSVPKNHKKKIRKLKREGNVSGKKFRAVIKGQDEFTQSEATSAFITGLGKSRSDTPPHYSQHLDNYEEQVLRNMSAFRAPTRSIVAPIDNSGSITGQQHPTEKDIPKLTGGSSGHSYADRERVHRQNQVFEGLSQDSSAPPNSLFLGSLLSSGVSTLSTMSFPLSAQNVPKFNQNRHEEQHKEREAIKKQVNSVAKKLSLPVTEEEVEYDAPLKAHKRPTSPKRLDKTTNLTQKNKPKPSVQKSIQSTTVTSSSQKKPEIKAVKSTQKNLINSVNHILTSIRIDLVNHPWMVPRSNHLNQMIQRAQGTDLTVQQSMDFLYNLFGNLNTLYHELEPYLVRSTTEQGGNQLTNDGYRMASLEQYMAECGQMAVHNLNALEHAQVNNDWDNLDAGLQNSENLRGFGNFENNIGEGEIRQLLESANRLGVPVIGNLGQLQFFVNQYNREERSGVMSNVQNSGATWLANQWHLGQVEIAEVENINNFIEGRTNQINFIINTEANMQIAVGSHWITVRLVRQQDGRIGIFYTDSLQGIRYYNQLFQSLRSFINQAQVQNAQQNGLGSKKSTKPITKPKSH